ncbi:MAG: hypothetical protein HYV63_00625 [Candidatus Schekmanbacteria bacterium]|nr:hypothetical protein [Candidatus Schekmanbacteria bacterium]
MNRRIDTMGIRVFLAFATVAAVGYFLAACGGAKDAAAPAVEVAATASPDVPLGESRGDDAAGAAATTSNGAAARANEPAAGAVSDSASGGVQQAPAPGGPSPAEVPQQEQGSIDSGAAPAPPETVSGKPTQASAERAPAAAEPADAEPAALEATASAPESEAPVVAAVPSSEPTEEPDLDALDASMAAEPSEPEATGAAPEAAAESVPSGPHLRPVAAEIALPRPPDLFLVGVVYGPGEKRRACLRGSALGGRQCIYKIGDHVGEYTVAEIQPRFVVLDQGGTRSLVALNNPFFRPTAGLAPVPQPPVMPPAAQPQAPDVNQAAPTAPVSGAAPPDGQEGAPPGGEPQAPGAPGRANPNVNAPPGAVSNAAGDQIFIGPAGPQPVLPTEVAEEAGVGRSGAVIPGGHRRPPAGRQPNQPTTPTDTIVIPPGSAEVPPGNGSSGPTGADESENPPPGAVSGAPTPAAPVSGR